jgi:hypothetical protein
VIYVFCLIPSLELDRLAQPAIPGMDGETPCDIIRDRDTVAVTCMVEEDEYSQERLQMNVQDPEWLRVAGSRHHACIEAYHRHYTVIPMAFGTIFTSEGSFFDKLAEQAEVIRDLFVRLCGQEEWNVRLYCNRSKLCARVAASSPAVAEFHEELTRMPAGRQFLMRKKADRLIADETDRQLSEGFTRIHEALLPLCTDHQSKQVWPKTLAAREEDMAANHAYLVRRASREQFLQVVALHHTMSEADGWVLEAVGPWPPYQFATFK